MKLVSLYICFISLFGLSNLAFSQELTQKNAPKKNVQIKADKNGICKGDQVKLQVDFPVGLPESAVYLWSNGAKTAEITVFPTETDTAYSVIVYNKPNDTTVFGTDATRILVSEKPNYRIVNDTTCVRNDAVIGVVGGKYYEWEHGASADMLIVFPDETTKFPVKISNLPFEIGFINACYTLDTAIAVIYSDENYVATTNFTDTVVCYGSELLLTVSSADSVIWNAELADSEPGTIFEKSFIIVKDTAFVVRPIDKDECFKDFEINVLTSPAADLSLTPDTSFICHEEHVEMLAKVSHLYTDNVNYEWSSGATGKRLRIQPEETIVYTVTATVFTANEIYCTETADALVVVKECLYAYFPTAINLRRSDVNKYFKPFGVKKENVEYYWAVFDRSGSRIFETTDFDATWDGTYNGVEVDAGVFAYYFRAIEDGEKWETSGTVTVIK